MITLCQIADDGEVWSLEDADGLLTLHHVTEFGRVVIPLPPLVLETLAARLRDRTPIRDRKQVVLPLRRRVA